MRYGFDEYARMLVDPVRGAAYFQAVRDTVTPGAVVADIGSGPGVLGVYAALLGARRVFLVDPDQSVLAGQALAAENGVGDRVEVIRARSTEIVLPERADVIISDLRGVTPFDGDHLEAARDMRGRLLAPGGTCIPACDTVWTSLVEDDVLHARTARAWTAPPLPVDCESLGRYTTNRWYRARVTGDQLLSEPRQFVELDYARPFPPLTDEWSARVMRDGTVHGLVMWFDTNLTESIFFSNAPSAPPALYGQAFFPFARPLPCRRDDVLHMSLRAVASGGDFAWQWGVTDGAGHRATHSTLLGAPLDHNLVHRRAAHFVPQRSEDAEVLQSLLQLADGSATLQQIAGELQRRFPQRFASEQAALDHVARHDDLWLSSSPNARGRPT